MSTLPSNPNISERKAKSMRHINRARFFALVMSLILIFTLLISYARATGSDISNSVLRLHILANSNTDADQQLKLAVRNRVLEETQGIFKNARSAKESARLAEEYSEFIQSIAEDEISKHGFNYPVSVSVEKAAFPTKIYGGLSLPSGKYTAVRIKIGKANGQNWWCVMYPPLCFADGVITASDEAKTALAQSLSEDSYNLVTGKNSGAIPVEIRFKIVELFQSLF